MRSTRHQADPAVRAVLITDQPGIFTSSNDIEDFMSRPPGSGSASPVAGVPVHARAGGHRQTGGSRRHRRSHRHRHHAAAALRPGLRVRRGAPGDAFRQPRHGAEFAASSLVVPRLLGNVKAAEKLLGDPFTPEAVDARIANAVLPAGRWSNHARRVATVSTPLPPVRCRTKECCAAPPRRRAEDHRHPRRAVQCARRSRFDGSLQAFFQAQASFSKFS